MIGMRSTRHRRRRNPSELILVNPGFPGQSVYRPRRRRVARRSGLGAAVGYESRITYPGLPMPSPRRRAGKKKTGSKKRRKKNMAVVRRRMARVPRRLVDV